MASAGGYRRIPALGGAQNGTTAELSLPTGTYYWTVQAVDTTLAAGSPFATEAAFTHYYCGYSDELAHLIEAGADMFLMPSRYEPCGLNQMFSLRYGTVPIVRKTGGLADSVLPFIRETREGTGFVFEHFTDEGLRWALRLALLTYRDRPLWRHLMSNGMLQDFSWKKQAKLYEELFSGLIPARS